MLVTSDIHRSIAGMTINLHKRIERRAIRSEDYELAEREYQNQYDISGSVGTLPVETTLTIPFGVSFVADAGDQRASSLDRPHFRHGFERVFGPAGIIPYTYIERWTHDDDFNFTGVVLTVGAHYPVLAIDSTQAANLLTFKFILHAAFQGFCVVWDPDGPLDAAGTQDNTGAL